MASRLASPRADGAWGIDDRIPVRGYPASLASLPARITAWKRQPGQASGLLSAVPCAVALGALSAIRPSMVPGALIVSLILALVLLPFYALVVSALGLLLWPLLWISTSTPGDTRFLLPVVALLALGQVVRKGTEIRMTPVPFGVAFLAMASLSSIIWSADPIESAAAGAALAAVAVLLIAAETWSDLKLRRAVVVCGCTLLLVNLGFAFVSAGILAGRTRGIFANPNSLALFCVLILPLLGVRKRTVPFALIAVVLVIASGSRAGALAVVVQALVAVSLGWRGHASYRRRLVVFVLLVSLAFGSARALDWGGTGYSFSAANQEISVLRSSDSRSATWTTALGDWQEERLLGRGAGAYQKDTANSYLKLLADLGLLGVLAASPLFILLWRRFWLADTSDAALVAGASINAAFESWMFTAGSFFFLLFWLQLLRRK